jgi:hypothetical protein
MSDAHDMEQSFQHHHATAVMLLARSKIEKRPDDPYYGYRDLARYIHDGIREPFDHKELYLRMMACAKAERLPLPSIGHMQALMAMVWDAQAIPPQYESQFHQVCHHVSEALCYDIGSFATDSMKSLAATLRVDLQVSLGYQNETGANANANADVTVVQQKDQQEPSLPAAKDGNHTLH